MKTPDSILLFVLGFIVWILGSVYSAYRGPSVLETTSLRYWISSSSRPHGHNCRIHFKTQCVTRPPREEADDGP
jgi:hypothetical protein